MSQRGGWGSSGGARRVPAMKFSFYAFGAIIANLFGNIFLSLSNLCEGTSEMLLSAANYKLQQKHEKEREKKITLQKGNFIESVLLDIENINMVEEVDHPDFTNGQDFETEDDVEGEDDGR
jgi:predicted membrane protein